MRLTLRTLGFLLLLTVACQGASPVHLQSRSGYVGSVGSRFRFKVTIEPDTKNRVFCLQWASIDSEGQSCHTLDAELAPRTFWREITFRTGGEFNVIAKLQQNDEKILISNIETITIVSRFGQ